MIADVDVQTPDLDDLVGSLERFAGDQLPYALSVAMNKTARETVRTIRDGLSSRFDLTSRSLARTFGPSGRMGDVSRGWSSKRQWPNLSVDIHSLAYAMELQEDGGIKPFQSSEVWIGTRVVPKSATTGKKLPRYQPARIKKRLASKQRHKDSRVFVRNDTVYERDRANEEIMPLYLIRQRATVEPALEAEEDVNAMFARRLTGHFQDAMERAQRSRR